jgi:hypothetical protein
MPTDDSAVERTRAWTPGIAPATSATGVPVRADLAKNCRSRRRTPTVLQVVPVVFVVR